MSAPLTYNRTMNKLIVLFHSIKTRKQIPMAENYANLLVKRTVENYVPKDKTLSGYWEKDALRALLSEIVANNVYRLLEDERK
jgi:hypothetical protein